MIAALVYAVLATGALLWLVCDRARRREALARAAHELRGPLQAIALGIGWQEGERRQVMELELARARLALDDLTAPRRGAPIEPVPAETLLVDAACAASARGAEVTTHWTGPDAAVWCARLRIAQALGNLVANAVEHGAGPVVLHGCAIGELVRFEVCDHGPGLPAPVAALTRRARAGRGRRGRGLAIAAGIASAHGGRLAAAPSRQGARLVLDLPIASVARDAPRRDGRGGWWRPQG